MLAEALGLGDRTESASLAASQLGQSERAAADNLFTECSGSFPAAPPERVVRGMSLRATSVLHVTHALGWEGQPDDSRLVLTREVVEGPDQGSRAAEVLVADLSETGKTAVGVLDRLGAATSRRLVDATIMRLSGTTAPDTAPDKPLGVFISYRFQDNRIATLLYDAFVAYGSHAFFRPYMDAHDLPAGAGMLCGASRRRCGGLPRRLAATPRTGRREGRDRRPRARRCYHSPSRCRAARRGSRGCRSRRRRSSRRSGRGRGARE